MVSYEPITDRLTHWHTDGRVTIKAHGTSKRLRPLSVIKSFCQLLGTGSKYVTLAFSTLVAAVGHSGKSLQKNQVAIWEASRYPSHYLLEASYHLQEEVGQEPLSSALNEEEHQMEKS